MKIIKKYRSEANAIAVLFLIIGSVGCAEEWVPLEREPTAELQLPIPVEELGEDAFIDMDIGTESQALGAPGSLNPLPARGGYGGNDFGVHDNGIVYAFRVRSGARVDQIQLAYYIPSNPDNQFRSGDFVGTIGPFGGNGGYERYWYYCPAGYGAVGLKGRSGSRIDRIGLICGKVGQTWLQTTTPEFGGNGGTSFYDTCDAGGFLSGIRGRSGAEVDRLQGLCRKQ